MDEAKNLQSGQGKCIRYCMSTPRGKIEVLGQLPDGKMLFKFNQAKNSDDAAKIMVLDLEPGQCWLY